MFRLLLSEGIGRNIILYIVSCEKEKSAKHDDFIVTISRLLQAELQEVKVSQGGDEKGRS